MDKLAELTTGAKIVLGGAIALLIVSFFDWFQIDAEGPLGDAGVSMWNGIGVVAGLLLLALIVWQALRLANINLEIGVTPAIVTAGLALLLLIFVFIRWIDSPTLLERTVWAWLGLLLAIVIAAGAWLNMQAAGESVQSVRDRFGSRATGTSEPPPSPTTTATPPPPSPPSTTTPSHPDETPPSSDPDRTP